ncbi:2,3-diaminopropionate biosynthesis protein SbnA [Pseudomonas carassii]|uniref:cysteine synthase n=1 Tax=Pseudomonas carassii TaxID=3115855 RepID=A0ABU7HGA4_9PSED|nr:2,3-diaminopropionate biosynthesis protein SbnA [Pseudomonas sp. 137P]MEE1890344.1 2,3-diaminopropionate biosynthesis protein SbnA [Pseudomonas sp. 137P]
MIYQHAYDIVLDEVFLELDELTPGSSFFLKIEGLNPAGSLKLKTAVNLINDAERRGVLEPGGHFIESSSGNLGIALAVVAASRGYHFTCVTDPNALRHSTDIIRALGAELVMVDWRDANGGFLASRIDYIRQRVEREPGLLWLNQYANPANPEAHTNHTARSLHRALGPLDYLFVPAGTTGTLMGCVAYFEQYSPQTRIIAVDALGSVTFGAPPGPRFIPGVGTSRRPEIFQPGSVWKEVLIAEEDAIRCCRWLARDHGLLAGGSTGSVIAAVQQLAPELDSGSRIAALSPDIGERYIQTIFRDEWVAQHFDLGRIEAQPRPAVQTPAIEESADAFVLHH